MLSKLTVFLILAFSISSFAQENTTEAQTSNDSEYLSKEEIARAIEIGTGRGDYWDKMRQVNVRRHYGGVSGYHLDHAIVILGPFQNLVSEIAKLHDESRRTYSRLYLSDQFLHRNSRNVVTIYAYARGDPIYDQDTDSIHYGVGYAINMVVVPMSNTNAELEAIHPISKRIIPERLVIGMGITYTYSNIRAEFDYDSFPRQGNIKIVIIKRDDRNCEYRIGRRHLERIY